MAQAKQRPASSARDINCWLEWFKIKIGEYDLKPWERDVNIGILSSLESRPMKLGKRPDSQLIDVDLIRGSAFEKAKTERSCGEVLLRGLFRSALLPLCLPWWRRHIGERAAAVALGLHAMLVIQAALQLMCPVAGGTVELAWPCLAFAALAILQSYVAAGADNADTQVAGPASQSTPPPLPPPPLPPPVMPEPEPESEQEQEQVFVGHELASSSDSLTEAGHAEGTETPRNASNARVSQRPSGRPESDAGSCGSNSSDFENNSQSDSDRLPSEQESGFSTWSDAPDSVPEPWQESSDDEEDSAVAAWIRQSQGRKRSSQAIRCFVWPHVSATTEKEAAAAPAPPSRHRRGRRGAIAGKVQLSMLDIGWCIIQAVERAPSWSSRNSLPLHILLPAGLSAAVPMMRWLLAPTEPGAVWLPRQLVLTSCRLALAALARLGVSCALYFVLCVADRTLWQRFLFAKHFCFLTSSRRAHKYRLPHFRLNKPRNIKVWLSLRSYLRRRGPQRSLDAVTSLAICVFLLASCLLCVLMLSAPPHLLLTGGAAAAFCDSLLAFASVGFFLIRYLAVGTKINQRFRDQPLLFTEQLNLSLAIDSKPHRKDRLQRAKTMLKETDDLLKALDSTYRIGGLVASPAVYHVSRVLIVSALSEVLSKLLGFKLTLDKINPTTW